MNETQKYCPIMNEKCFFYDQKTTECIMDGYGGNPEQECDDYAFYFHGGKIERVGNKK